MKINKLKILIIMISFIFGLIFYTGEVQAVLQSNGGAAKTYSIANWLTNIRKMESAGGTFGLNANIDSTTLEDTTESNKLDVHMQLNTEYGAMAILSASAYGNPGKVEDGGTTTGNSTGIVMKINKEWVSAGMLTSDAVYPKINAKYKNLYSTRYVAKVGDAISETTGWHGSTASTWIAWDAAAGLIRAYSGSIFSYEGNGIGSGYPSWYTKSYSSRAVVVVGEGM